MHMARRLEKIEGALMGNGIPKAERLQIIGGTKIIGKGIGEDGEFIPNIPGDSVEARKRILLERYGSAEGVIFIELIDRWETSRSFTRCNGEVF